MPAFLLDFLRYTPIGILGSELIVLMAIAFVGGRILHIRQVRKAETQSRDYEAYLVSSVLGLLALLLGFTFSLAINRYEERRELVIAQANAIGTAYLRSQLLGEPHRRRLSQLLVEYTDNLIALGSVPIGQGDRLLAKDDALMTDIWSATAAAFDSVRSVSLSISLTQAVNGMLDLDASRRNLRVVHIPLEVFAVLLVYLIGAAAVLGYALVAKRGRLVGAFILILMSLSFLLIIDIDRPTSGLIREDQAPMLSLRDSLKKQPPEVFDRWRRKS